MGKYRIEFNINAADPYIAAKDLLWELTNTPEIVIRVTDKETGIQYDVDPLGDKYDDAVVQVETGM